MKNIAFVALLSLTILLGWSCSGSGDSNPYSPGTTTITSTPTSTPSFTPTGSYTATFSVTPTPTATVSIGSILSVISGPHYSISGSGTALSATIVINHGQAVVWDSSNSGHPLNIDNGAGSCVVSGLGSFPATQLFSTAGTFQFHCGIHSSCGNGTCPGTCSGNMVGTIQVN